MNQIPNIEETQNTKEVEAWKNINRLEGECAECGGTGEGADNPCSDHGETYPCYVCNGTGSWSVYRKKDVDKFLHHQLQKAREEERERILQIVNDVELSYAVNDGRVDGEMFGGQMAASEIRRSIKSYIVNQEVNN